MEHSLHLREPHLSRFSALVKVGAGSADISGFDEDHAASEAFVAREVERAEQHRRSLIPLLRPLAPDRILDVGCSTGGTTAALAASFDADVVGIDVSPLSVDAAQVRLQGLGLTRASALLVDPNKPWPFEPQSFDLVVCVSVLEFVPTEGDRERFLAQIAASAREYVYISTPSPYAWRELHSGRVLGNQRKTPESPWASTASWIGARLPGFVRQSVPRRLSRWQKLLFRRVALMALVSLLMPECLVAIE